MSPPAWGASAIHLAREFGCEVVGIDYGASNAAAAGRLARAAGLEGRVAFAAGDAERLPFGDSRFDAVICECAFCTFPDKPAAAAELARALRPGGVVGLADLVRTVRLRLMGAEVAAHLGGVELPGGDLARARELGRAAERAVAGGSLGYVLIVARRPRGGR